MSFKLKQQSEFDLLVSTKSQGVQELQYCDLKTPDDSRDESITANSSTDRSLTFIQMNKRDLNDQHLHYETKKESFEMSGRRLQDSNLNSNMRKKFPKEPTPRSSSVFERLSITETTSSRSLKSIPKMLVKSNYRSKSETEKMISPKSIKHIPKDNHKHKKTASKISREQSRVPIERLVSQFDALNKLRQDCITSSTIQENMKVANDPITSTTYSNDSDFGELPIEIEFRTVMSIYLQDGYKSESYIELNSQEMNLNQQLVDFSNDKMTSKELSYEIINILFKQDLPSDCNWVISVPLTREIVSPIGENGYSILIEAGEVSNEGSRRISSATAHVYFVYDCNEIQIENYSFMCTSSPQNLPTDL